MTSFKFSILIPTRERASTLGPCIETCLAQKYDNLEIIVSDNASSPETRKVVDSFSDSRLKYCRQDKRLSMRQNFEFLVNQASGDYIIIIGDDDGMMPNAISEMQTFLSSNPVDVLNWTSVVYNWPGRLIKDRGFILLKFQKIFGTVNFFDPATRLKSFMAGRTQSYVHGCNLYHGCVRKKVLEELRDKTGQFFAGHMPDVYACIALLFVAKSAAYFNHPLSIAGISPASNGFSFFTDIETEKTEAKKPTPHQLFSNEADRDPGVARPYNTELRAAQYSTAIALSDVNDAFGKKHVLDVNRWAQIIVKEAKGFCDLLKAKASLDAKFQLDSEIISIIDNDPAIVPELKPPHNPAGKLSEKFNRLMVATSRDGKDNVMTAFKVLGEIFAQSRIEKRNIFTRFLSWLALREKCKPYILFKS